MRNLLSAAGVVVGCLATLVACDMGLQEKLDQKKAERFEKAANKVAGIEAQRYETFTATLPKSEAKPDERTHPIVEWRYQAAEMQYIDQDAKEDERKAAQELMNLLGKRFESIDEREAEVKKVIDTYKISGDYAKALTEAGSASRSSDFKSQLRSALARFSPIRDYEATLTRLADEYKGVPAEQAARDGAVFAKESREFWEHAKKNNYGKMSGTVNKYVSFLEGYLKKAAENAEKAEKEGRTDFVQRPFLEEAAFDIVFVHAANLYSGTNPVPFWELAFDFPHKGTPTLSSYVTRLCRESAIREECKKVPHELRIAAIRKPYLEWVKKAGKAYKDKYAKPEVFSKVLSSYEEKLDHALAQTPDLTEDPVMPSTFADRAASRGFQLTLSKKRGSVLEAKGMEKLQFEDEFDGNLPRGYSSELKKKIEEIKESETTQVDFETIILEAPGDTPGKTVSRLLAGVPLEYVRKFDLVGRRRADESMRRTGILLRLPDEGGKTESYQFKGMEDRVKCPYLGYGGKLGRREKPGAALVIDKESMKAATLDRVKAEDEETETLVAGDFTLDAKPGEIDKLTAWADKNAGIVRFFISDDFTWDQIMTHLSAVLYKCEDQTVKYGRKLEKTLEIKCGKTEERDITFVLSICD